MELIFCNLQASARTVSPVAVGAHIAAGLQPMEEAFNQILFLVKIVVQAQRGC